jgi:hypothetical protein
MLLSHTNGLHHELLLKIYILVKLCARNYAIVDGLVNGANGIFQDYTKNSELLIWIYFHNSKNGINT